MVSQPTSSTKECCIRIRTAGVAELVDALDLGSSILGCESSSLSFRTMFLIRTKTHPNLELGYRQAVRHQVLILAFPGSNPGIPANLHTFLIATHTSFKITNIFTFIIQYHIFSDIKKDPNLSLFIN
jgi:hypothetical protein